MGTLNVVHYHRNPHSSDFSFERVFALVRKCMPTDISCSAVFAARKSQGFFPRAVNCLQAVKHQKDINHITGDIHYIAVFLRKRKTVLTIHDLSSLQRLKGIKRFIYLLFWFYLPVWRVNRVTVISEATRQELIQHVPWARNKVTVIHDPCSPEFIHRPRVFNTEKPRILQIGTRPNKNLPRLAAALKDIPCILDIVGRLTDEQGKLLEDLGLEYQQSADLSDQQVVEKFEACDMLAFVSLYEGFGLPILEAQATGRPVVTSNILSMPEVAGGGACLVDPYNTASIREGILKVIDDKENRSRLVAAGLENVKRFFPREIAERYAAVYREMVEK
ncbi:glycosyltransferase family 4 protein [candidate division KSB1 bacterium]|nr:glycosyltransferase family 4 protein [candidate division KSB1 bacterium]